MVKFAGKFQRNSSLPVLTAPASHTDTGPYPVRKQMTFLSSSDVRFKLFNQSSSEEEQEQCIVFAVDQH